MIWRACSFRSSFVFRLSVKPHLFTDKLYSDNLSVKHPLSPDKIELLVFWLP